MRTMKDLDDESFDSDGSMTQEMAMEFAAAVEGAPDSVVAAEASYQRARTAAEKLGKMDLAHRAGITAVVTWGMRAARKMEPALARLADPVRVQALEQNFNLAANMLAAVAKKAGGEIVFTNEQLQVGDGECLIERSDAGLRVRLLSKAELEAERASRGFTQ